jgi:hypothetical protein
MISGAHAILYSRDAEADRAFLKDVLGLPHVDVGHGWLIFGLPPSEVAVHPSETGGKHELYLLCDDIEALVGRLGARGVACGERRNLGWGVLSEVTLPSGVKIGVYEPRHARPPSPKPAAKKKKAAAKTTKKAAKPAKKKALAKRRAARRR